MRSTLFKVWWEGYDKKDDTTKDLEKLVADRLCEVGIKSTDDLTNTPKHTERSYLTTVDGHVIRYQNTSNLEQHYIRGGEDHYIRGGEDHEYFFHYWSGSLSGNAHFNQTYPNVV